MTLTEIYNAYTHGSLGFANAVSNHCGFEISYDEIQRIAGQAKTAAEFQRIWEDEDWWVDPENA